MLFVLTAPNPGVSKAPAYDGNIIGVYETAADVQSAHGVGLAEGRGVVIVPEGVDTHTALWDALSALQDAGIAARVDANQHELVEARGFAACVVAGELDNAPTRSEPA